MPHSGSPVVTRLGGIGNRLLSPLPRADFDLLAPELETVALDQEAVVARAGDRVEHVFFPNSGAISLMIDMANGQTVATALVGRDGLVGSLSVLGPLRSAITAIVRVAGTASRIPVSRFHAAFNRSPAIRHAVQIHMRVSSARPAMRCIRSKPAWHAGCSIFATASIMTSSRLPRTRCRKYLVCDERR